MQENENEKEKNSQLKILVCCHKPCTLPPDEDGVLLPVQVGAALTDKRFGFQTDNEVNGQPCDNISAKNESYCELTAMYWAWKNLKKIYPDVKYVGLFHYRRFFAFDERKFLEASIIKSKEKIFQYRLDTKKIINLLEHEKIIVPVKIIFPYSLAVDYCMVHMSDDYKILREIIENNFPDYSESFEKIMEHNNGLLSCNMFIMKYEDFEKYCAWLFDLLALVEKKVPYQKYNPYQKRIFGFMSERLLNVWLKKNKKKLKSCNLYFYDDNAPEKNTGKALTLIKFFIRLIVYLQHRLALWLATFDLELSLQKIKLSIFKRPD